ncbi:MAG: T9SS type A sorting domain-containing protein [Bacteroidia bacterium]|nr:T9SS type A sorting domain-containing protein [Bacteroidia bacterium]
MKKLLFLVLLINILTAKGQVSYIPGPPALEEIEDIISLNGYFLKFLKKQDTAPFKILLSKDSCKSWEEMIPPWNANYKPDLFIQKNNFGVFHTQTGVFLTHNLSNFTYLGTPVKPPALMLSNTKSDLIGKYANSIPSPTTDNISTIAWVLSTDYGFTWSNISQGLKSYTDVYWIPTDSWGNTIAVPYNTIYSPYCLTKTDSNYFALYKHDFLPKGISYDLVRFDFKKNKWENIENTNYYNIVKDKGDPIIRYYSSESKTLFLEVNFTLYKSSDKGKNWIKCGTGINLALPECLNVKLYERNDTLFALTLFKQTSNNYNFSSNLYRLYYSTDKGSSFSLIEIDIPKGYHLYNSHISSQGQIFLFGIGHFYQKIPAYQFSEDIPPKKDVVIGKIIPINDSAILINPSNYYSNGKYSGVSKTTNNGKSWRSLTQNILNYGGIKDLVANGDTILALAPYPIKSTDGGETWSVVSAIGDSNIICDNVQYVMGKYTISMGRQIYESKDLIKWENKMFQNYNPYVSDLFNLGLNLFADGLISNDSGKTWLTTFPSKHKQPVKNVVKIGTAFLSYSNKDWVGNSNMEFSISYDQGFTWKDTIIPVLMQSKSLIENPYFLFFNTESQIYIIDKNTLKPIKLINHYKQRLLGDIMIWQNNKLYISADGGGLFIYDVSMTTGEKETTCCTNYFSIYPNPANRYIIIENPENESIHCSLINLAGNEVLKYSGNGRLNIVTAEVPEGLYFIKSETSKGIQYSKILIMH